METKSVSINERLDRIEHLIALNKPVLSFDEAVSYTGLSKSYLYKMTAARQIPHSKPNGKQLYFERVALDHWLMRNEVKTAEAIEQEAATIVTLKRVSKSGRK
jgi:excisionase family DNA binding protein